MQSAVLSERRDHLPLREFSQSLLPGKRMCSHPPPAPAPARKRYGRVASFLNARQLEPPPNGSKTITVSHSLPPAPLFLEETRFHRSLVARDYVIRRNNNIVSLGNDCC